jgi:TolB protein
METNPQVKTSTAKQRSSPFLYSAFFSLLILSFTPSLHAQDWVRTGSNLGVSKIRLAAADFKPSSADPQTPVLKATFDNTLYNDLSNAGIFDMVPKSMARPPSSASNTVMSQPRTTPA